MPRNVRNWWASAVADGGRRVELGPQAADGGIDIRILARDRGEIVKSFTLSGIARRDGSLELTVYGPDGAVLGTHVTHR